jgi:exosortase E/protease (VPEID-CTERM system)
VSTSLPGIAPTPVNFGLIARLGVVGAVLAIETLLASYLIQATPIDAVTGGAEILRYVQHWMFRFIIAYAVTLATLVYLRGTALAEVAAPIGSVRMRFCVLHALLLVPFGYLSSALYTASAGTDFAVVALAWHVCAIAAALALFAALAPIPVWFKAVRQIGGLALFAILPAAAAVAAIRISQMLWSPAAKLTFRIVVVLLHPLLPALHSDPATNLLATDRFGVQISEICSGLEGVGLMLAFCAGWLWIFRREYYFPRALIVVPLGVILVFLLNAVRIAALVLIGDAGYGRIASLGFHSQAGWIAFNLAAVGVALLAQTNPWLNRTARIRASAANAAPTVAPAAATNPTAAYLMPLLAILATGMIAHALSAGFEFLYSLRFFGALAVLWVYRRSYGGLDLSASWRGPAVGIAVFCVWISIAAFMIAPATEPSGLASLSAPLRALWIAGRVLAAICTVPIAEELAYRGYLMRRLVGPRFETIPLSAARWPALALSALAFGIGHGELWLAGTAAGLAYGALAIRTNRLGECIVAHATTNVLLAAYVLLFHQWQFW